MVQLAMEPADQGFVWTDDFGSQGSHHRQLGSAKPGFSSLDTKLGMSAASDTDSTEVIYSSDWNIFPSYSVN